MGKKLLIVPNGGGRGSLFLKEGINCDICPPSFVELLEQHPDIKLLAITKENNYCDGCVPWFLNLLEDFDAVAYVFDNIQDDRSWRHAESMTESCRRFARFTEMDDAIAWLDSSE